jgi:hypothetical protein
MWMSDTGVLPRYFAHMSSRQPADVSKRRNTVCLWPRLPRPVDSELLPLAYFAVASCLTPGFLPRIVCLFYCLLITPTASLRYLTCTAIDEHSQFWTTHRQNAEITAEKYSFRDCALLVCVLLSSQSSRLHFNSQKENSTRRQCDE